MSTSNTNATLVKLEQAHGTVMIFAWIVFASTGILFARYGRLLRFGEKSKLFGADIWFQMHRSILILAVITTLIGLVIVLVKGDNETVEHNRDKSRLTAHRVLGFIIVGSALLQVGMGLFRCGPQSPSRFIFNWIHRSVGIIAFVFSIPTLFLVASVLQNNQTGLMIILSLWAAWIVIIVIVLEIIKFRCQLMPSTIEIKNENGKHEHELSGEKVQRVPSASKTEQTEPGRFNNLKLFLFFSNLIVAISLAIPLIVIVWQQ
ncbi:unnamed protein product [Rotaria sp. Silwood1]|nr:unnamed protein product [Rotaria sp. Silwood1]CAF3599828.1 unnamed protein product [Rotaria sp. Silwood1]CAF3983645.1 unnamed protein product [Rotaria sp. Silwood1]CAF4648466.1 unnamed protein product [Rotaria sp. Silwood1]CAF4922487.1 unnamed protein product [Rotaria sp. Silwood1]